MKNIQRKINNFQKIYASEFVTLIFIIAAIEIYLLVMVIFGGAR